ncbi:hypothetical protein [Lysobacter enzymogenes]
MGHKSIGRPEGPPTTARASGDGTVPSASL